MRDGARDTQWGSRGEEGRLGRRRRVLPRGAGQRTRSHRHQDLPRTGDAGGGEHPRQARAGARSAGSARRRARRVPARRGSAAEQHAGHHQGERARAPDHGAARGLAPEAADRRAAAAGAAGVADPAPRSAHARADHQFSERRGARHPHRDRARSPASTSPTTRGSSRSSRGSIRSTSRTSRSRKRSTRS